MQVHQAFGIEVDKHVVRRILAKHYKPRYPGGPSWLTFFNQAKDSLWSIDLFRCESIHLKSYWVMLAIDINTRRLIGFAAHAGNLDGATACRAFNQLQTGRSPPRWISTDHDPLFTHHRWKASLRILGIEEVKTDPERQDAETKSQECPDIEALNREVQLDSALQRIIQHADCLLIY